VRDNDMPEQIALDEKLEEIFGRKTLEMSNIEKCLVENVLIIVPKCKGTTVSAEKHGNSKERPSKKRKSKDSAPKKARGNLFGGEMQLSEALAEVVGESRLVRTQVVKKIWDYIKKENLQNPSNKREIICDEKLRKVMGKAKLNHLRTDLI